MAACGEPGEDAALYETVRAVGEELCPALGIAIPVGKDSLSMKTVWREGDASKSVVAPVSLIISAFAPVTDVRRTLTPALLLDERPDVPVAHRSRRRPQPPRWLGAGAGVWRVGDVPPDLDDPQRLAAISRPRCLSCEPRICSSPITIAPMAACSRRCSRWHSPGAVDCTSHCRLRAGRAPAQLFSEELGVCRADHGRATSHGSRSVLAKHGLSEAAHLSRRADGDMRVQMQIGGDANSTSPGSICAVPGPKPPGRCAGCVTIRSAPTRSLLRKPTRRSRACRSR